VSPEKYVSPLSTGKYSKYCWRTGWTRESGGYPRKKIITLFDVGKARIFSLPSFFLDNHDHWSYSEAMTGQDLKNWRKRWGITQIELARLLGTYQETISRWEREKRGTPSHLSLALEALEHRMMKGGKDGLTG
jgi:DNA-binding transcriptional regulator YiaG